MSTGTWNERKRAVGDAPGRLPKRTTLLLLAAALVTTAAAGADSSGYRWVDDDGTVHFGDTPPPEARGSHRDQVSTDGRVIQNSVPSVEAIEDAAEAPAGATDAEQAERDRLLMRTFTEERDLIMTRDDRLAGVDTQIILLERRIDQLDNRLGRLQARHDSTTDEVRRADIDERMVTLAARIDDQRGALARHHQRREEMERKFEADLQRFRELKAGN